MKHAIQSLTAESEWKNEIAREALQCDKNRTSLQTYKHVQTRFTVYSDINR